MEPQTVQKTVEHGWTWLSYLKMGGGTVGALAIAWAINQFKDALFKFLLDLMKLIFKFLSSVNPFKKTPQEQVVMLSQFRDHMAQNEKDHQEVRAMLQNAIEEFGSVRSDVNEYAKEVKFTQGQVKTMGTQVEAIFKAVVK